MTVSRWLAAAAVVGSYAAQRVPATEEWDARLATRVARPRGETVDRVVGVGTDLGSVFALAGCVAILAAAGHRRRAVEAATSGLLAWTAAQALKPLVGRARPYQADGLDRLVAPPAGSSWPSGHPAVVAAVATALAPSLPGLGRGAGAGLAGGVAASRVYVGVHYPTDVVGGLGLGVLCGGVARAALGRLRSHRAT